jgi:hypothetical protein
MWVRGRARIDGDDIVLYGGTAEPYEIPRLEHGASLLFDLGGLGKLGEIVDSGEDSKTRLIDAVRLKDTGRALEFVEAHGLLWHGPRQVGKGEVRESLRKWFLAGLDMSINIATYSNIRLSQEEDSAEPVRSYLRALRDAGFFKLIALPDDDNDLLEWASIQLAERISRGMVGGSPTLSAASGLSRDGVKVGGAGDFRFGYEPSSLIGAANYQLALLVSRKKLVRECAECGEMFLPTDPRQREHKKCGNRRRKRESRQQQ